MSYGVALRNGVPFTLGTIAALCVNATSQWSPLALWPNGVNSPGMWSSPSTLPASFNDYTGTTPIAVPGSVADSANPVGLALDIRAGAPTTLGPELVTNGDFSDGTTGWTPGYMTPAISVSGGQMSVVYDGGAYGRVTAPITCVVGRMYQVSMSLVSSTGPVRRSVTENSAGVAEVVFSDSTTPGVWTAIFTATQTTLWACVGLQGASSGQEGVFANISIREIPGNHMLQSTSAARPLESARVNLLTYTEDFSAGWAKFGCTTSAQTPPQGYSSAIKYIKDSGGGFSSVYRYYNVTGPFVFSAISKRAEWQYLGLYLQNPDRFGYFDLLNGVVGTVSAGLTATIEDLGDGWYRCAVAHTANGTNTPSIFATPTDNVYSPTGDGVAGIYVTAAQYNSGGVSAPYQPIPTDGSTYPSTGITPFQLYDGVDDGMATAAFAAGTLIDGMDCLIAVRRDSAASCVAGLYNGVADATKFFGMAESASGSGCVGSGAGTPTVWVDNTQLTGGTAVTRGTLHTALTVGDWHILEFRNLDLSTWAAAGFGLYTSYLFTGPRGDILLYPSTDPTEDKDAARQWLADYYGVTLP